MLEGTRKPGPRRASDATPDARVAAPTTPATGKSTAPAKPTDDARRTEKRTRLHYHRLFRRLGELQWFLNCLPDDPATASRESWTLTRIRNPGVEPPHSVRFDAFARDLKDLERGLREILGDLESENWTPALLERCYRDAALAVVKKELPILEARAQSGRRLDYTKFAKARRRKKTLLAHERKVRAR